MAEKQTEKHHEQAAGLDLRADADILTLLAAGQAEAARAVTAAIPAIAKAAELAAASLRDGGRLIYAAAGSSGLMALADALELPGTYGIAGERIVVLLAGGAAALTDMKGGPEDDGDAAHAAILALEPGINDCVIALTASGQTPYPIAAVKAAKAAGARAIGIANNADAALFGLVDVPVCLPTPPEVIAGSTRMGAGTAQKIALNMLSTLMAVRLGHVHDGFMVNLVADNTKLRGRARGIVAAVAQVSDEAAAEALDVSGGAVKPAVLIALGLADLRAATALLDAHGGNLRQALAARRD
ncbi:N-acetylmuramic acid 6-phosphate etherase [Devosia sp. YIM 151766]|uniref:N-acetylmuramic acid 6-phosphate etherase n=1 Tax=Devosia sp. YIM 151766 TaxID=3017325 RepID=UPI00255CCAEF|nr:N-acetylmuramic acid 6-phosphate etherase [Devosia sp. YIM 151766]WIY53966.1 N-acetylmuramic acid 6-phosphate etherase [Devosia sp. YIM 151766]